MNRPRRANGPVNDDRKLESEERSWLERLTHFISGEPQNKSDLEGVLSLAVNNEIIDEDARKPLWRAPCW